MRIKIIPTYKRGCCAVPRTPASPTIPTAKPAAKPDKPTLKPAPKWWNDLCEREKLNKFMISIADKFLKNWQNLKFREKHFSNNKWNKCFFKQNFSRSNTGTAGTYQIRPEKQTAHTSQWLNLIWANIVNSTTKICRSWFTTSTLSGADISQT